MALDEAGGGAPYAPTRAVTTAIDNYRDRSIVPTAAALQRMGIEQSLIGRTVNALKQLDLMGDDGEPTSTLMKIRTVQTDELGNVLSEWLRDVYMPIFKFVNPTDDVQRITDQFRHYEPAGQRNRMVTLFLGLSAKAGLIDEVPPLPRARSQKRTNSTSRTETPPRKRDKGEKNEHGDSDPSDPPLTTARERYIEMLLAKAADQDSPEIELLDRIERALGIPPAEKESST